MNSVLVLLSTYNGERYLREQLDSLYAQEEVELQILVRDDGSSDTTSEIINEYKQKKGRLTVYYDDNVGANYSFFKLIEYAVTDMPKYDYYAFCDQDDVWFKDKLCVAIKQLESTENEYKLLYTGYISTDAELNPIKSDNKVREINSIGANIVSNHIQGCRMVFNRGLLEKINLINSEKIKEVFNEIPSFHDSWTMIVAYALGGLVIDDPIPRMYYRQHGHNVVGDGGGKWNLFVKRVRTYLTTNTCSKSFRCKCVQILMGDEIPLANRELIDLCANYKSNFSQKIRLLFRKEIYEYGLTVNLGVFILVLFNKF